MASPTTRPPRHYNPEPRFGLRVRPACHDCGREMWPDENPVVDLGGGVLANGDDYGDGWCVDCGDPFHLDDIGGYNPPCACGLHCRSCHERCVCEDDYGDYDDYPPHSSPRGESLMAETIEVRVIGKSRRFTTFAIIEPRRGRNPLRSEVVRNNRLDSCYCRACKSADGGLASGCRHITAARRFAKRAHLTVVDVDNPSLRVSR